MINRTVWLVSALTAIAVPLAPSTANAVGVATSVDPSCAMSPGDADEAPRRFTEASTRFKGLCMDTAKYRPIHNLERSAERIRFRNYVHENRFWNAELATGDGSRAESGPVEAVWFQVMRFAVVEGVEAAHSQLRFKLKRGREIRLTSQIDGARTLSDDVLVTFEAGLPRDQSYNFALGAFDAYALVARVGSARQKYIERRGPVSMEQYELRLEPAEMTRLLTASLERSQEIGADRFYNTLRPNCTTELFDMIDVLPRVQGIVQARGLRPFLTFLSTDPIATPSLRALRERGLLGVRGPNFEDEVEGRSTPREMPTLVDQLPPYVPVVDGRPWTVVVSRSNPARLSREENEALDAIRDEIVASAIRLLQTAAAAFVLARDDAFADVLGATLSRLPTEIARSLRSIDPRLPTRLHKATVHVVPMPSSGPTAGTPVDLTRFGLPAALPISARSGEWNLATREGRALASEITLGSIFAANAAAATGTPAYLLGVSVVVNAARGRSNIVSQIRAGLKPLERPFESKNEQVEIDTLRLGSAALPVADRPTLLLTHRQAASSEVPNPLVRIDFGPDGGLASDANGDGDSEREATFQVRSGLEDCRSQAVGAPHLTGVFGPRPTERAAINSFLSGRPVAFQVLSLDLDLVTMRAIDIDVRVRAWPYSCAEDQGVDTQFRGQANEALERLKASGAVNGLLSRVMGPIR